MLCDEPAAGRRGAAAGCRSGVAAAARRWRQEPSAHRSLPEQPEDGLHSRYRLHTKRLNAITSRAGRCGRRAGSVPRQRWAGPRGRPWPPAAAPAAGPALRARPRLRSGPAPRRSRALPRRLGPVGSDALRLAEVTRVACGPGPVGGVWTRWLDPQVCEGGSVGPGLAREGGARGRCSGGASAKASGVACLQGGASCPRRERAERGGVLC